MTPVDLSAWIFSDIATTISQNGAFKNDLSPHSSFFFTFIQSDINNMLRRKLHQDMKR